MDAANQNTLLLIDGHSLAFRAFFALNPNNFRNQEGQHTNAVHGFISMLLNILEGEKPTHLCVAFDVSRESFRTKELPEYKGTRGETPPEFIGQTELLEEALDAMNIKSVSREMYEADDLIASLAKQGEDAGMRVLVVSGARDTFQLITEQTTVLYPIKGVMNLARMNDEAVYEKYGVHAVQYPELAALVGETSDNLKGIPGVGPKTAAKWIQEYGSLENILTSAGEIPGKVGESLREHSELAVRNRRLNHLVRDLEFDFQVSDLKLGPVNEEQLKSVFAKLSFRTLLTRVLKLRGTNGTQHNHGDLPPQTEETVQEVQLPSEVPAAKAADVDTLKKALNETAFVHIEIAEGQLVGFGLANPNLRLDWDGRDRDSLTELIRTGGFGVWNKKLLTKQLQAIGINLGPVSEDAMLIVYLIDATTRDFNLDALVRQYAGVDVVRQDANQLLAQSEPSLDAWCASTLFEALAGRLQAEESTRVYREIEMPVAEVLADMESIGIAVRREDLQSQFNELETEAEGVAQQAYAIIGHEVNLASPKQLQTVLFEELGMQGTRSVKTGYSTNAEALATLYEQTEHPFLERLLAHRDVTKLKQITETLLKSVAEDGRIHTSYSQVGTATGRLSSENPNLQNIPIKSERGMKLRSAFVAGEGFETLLTADYSQIEMRIMAHLSEDEGLIEAFRAGEDLHNFVGARIYDVQPKDVTPQMRSKVKAMSYGLVYGLSEYGLARQLKISKTEAKELMADYFARFGGVKRYLDTVVQRAKSLGYTATVYGRRRPFDDLNSKIFQVRENARRAALNAPIQGTAADIMKLAMIDVSRKVKAKQLKSQLLLQVHDELVFAVFPGELDELRELAVESMSNVAQLSVPLEVHIGIGENWELAGH